RSLPRRRLHPERPGRGAGPGRLRALGARRDPGRRAAARAGLPLRGQPGDVRALPRLQDRAGPHRLHPPDPAGTPVNEIAATQWHVVIGSHLDQVTLVLICTAAGFAVALSAVSLIWEQRRARAAGLFALRFLGVAACLMVALQPSLELGQVARVPNHVAVVVDTSRSMAVSPPDSKHPRYQRAADLIKQAAPLFQQWEREGHRVELYSFGESLSPATPESLASPPRAEATRIGETLSELRGRYAGRDLGGVVIVSDGIDTGRVGRGPLDGETRKTLAA